MIEKSHRYKCPRCGARITKDRISTKRVMIRCGIGGCMRRLTNRHLIE